VRFLRPFRVYKRGDVVEMEPGHARAWIIAGIVAAEPEPRLMETATLEVRAESADATPRRRRR
jgi:ribosomal protein L9